VRALALALLVVAAPATAGLHHDLTGNRLMFAEGGGAKVPVRLMEDQTKVSLQGDQVIVLEVIGAADDKPKLRLEVPAGQPIEIVHTGGAPAQVDERWVLETLEHGERQKRKEARKRWRERGVKVDLVRVGGTYGVQGTVVDNRALLVTAKKLDPAAIFKKHGVQPKKELLPRAKPKAGFRVVAMGKARGFTEPAEQLVRLVSAGPILVRRVHHSIGYKNEGFADRTVRGEVVVAPDKRGKLAVVNLLPTWAYVAGILPSEMFASAPLEALKAQAVTARGELFAKIGRRHLTDPYLVCSEQHCQVYKGLSAEHPRTNDAAKQTAGELAFQSGRLVDSVYSACCGGHTEDAHVVWARPSNPALRGRPDSAGGKPVKIQTDAQLKRFLAQPRATTWCGRSTFNQKGTAYRWTRRLTVDELTKKTRDLGVGRVKKLVVEGRGPGGRLTSLRIEGDRKTATVHRELPVRRRFGNLRSGMFVVEEERDPAGALVAVTFRGGGFGHGSGMCQQGAIGMAEAGHDYRAILRHYYGGATVRKVF
jgi:SpoIID/LytB domain protein